MKKSYTLMVYYWCLAKGGIYVRLRMGSKVY